MGLGALALENTPRFPTYPRGMTQAEVASGLVLPYMSQAVAGKGGAAAILLTLFMVSLLIVISIHDFLREMQNGVFLIDR